MNRWLDATVVAYRKYFGAGTHYPVVWDVGSRDGEDGVELAERIWLPEFKGSPFWEHATVNLVEANPKQASIIADSYPRANLYETAVSDMVGRSTFTQLSGRDKGWVGSSKLGIQWDYEQGAEGMTLIEVPTTRLDLLLGDKEVVDIMKIDCEGWSWEVLHGLSKRIYDVKVYHIETEHADFTPYHHKGHKDNEAVAAFMRSKGFELFMVEYEYGGIQDQIWFNPKLAEF